MPTRRYLCLSILLCLFLTHPGSAQDKRLGNVPSGTKTDPFSISEGSSFSASGSGSSLPGGRVVSTDSISADFQEALRVIGMNYAGPAQTDAASLTAESVTSMLKTLDPHSSYFVPSEFQEMLDEHASEYTGTGSSIAAFENAGVTNTFVVSTLPGSPASKAGLRFGDKIIAVDGRPAAGVSPDSVREMLIGKPGTVTRILIEPAGGPARTVEIRRERLHDTAVPAGFELGNGVGYIDLTRGFSNATYAEFNSAVAGLKGQGARSLIVDLRGNGGGILDQAIKVAEKFLPAGSLIVSQRGRYPGENRDWRSTNTKYESMPLVLLVDENSASATEVLAGALQDNDRALIVGRKTFGKGLVQSVLPLPHGAGLTLTAARYFTPSGRSIQRDYADAGLYNYYRHHKGESNIDKPFFAAKTVTKRVVYGGDGITPDETFDSASFTAARISLLDPLFFFVRKHADPGASDPRGGLREIRRKILFGEPIVDDAAVTAFSTLIESDEQWKDLRPVVEREMSFVRGMLAYYLAMAAFGQEAAEQVKIEGDPAVLRAISALPRSEQLAAAAQRIRTTRIKEKSSSSLVLDERR